MKDFQKNVIGWVNKTFGHQKSETRKKGFRFLEEATEFVESLGMTKEEALKVVEYVYDREKPGEPFQELGGVMVTLTVVSEVNGLDMFEAAKTEFTRCEANSEKIAAKDKRKPDFVKGERF